MISTSRWGTDGETLVECDGSEEWKDRVVIGEGSQKDYVVGRSKVPLEGYDKGVLPYKKVTKKVKLGLSF